MPDFMFHEGCHGNSFIVSYNAYFLRRDLDVIAIYSYSGILVFCH